MDNAASKHTQQPSLNNSKKRREFHRRTSRKLSSLTMELITNQELTVSDLVLKVMEGNDEDLHSVEEAFPLPPAELRRGVYVVSTTTDTQPGAVHVEGISNTCDNAQFYLDCSSTYEDELEEESQHLHITETPLVNAELVVQPDEEIPALPIMRTATDSTITTDILHTTANYIPAEIFEATPLKPHDENSKPTLSEFLQNGTVKLILVILTLIIVGLIIGVVLGLTSRQVVIEVEDEADIASYFQSMHRDSDSDD